MNRSRRPVCRAGTAAHRLRNRNIFTRDDDTPRKSTLVTINEWSKKELEWSACSTTPNSHHRYDVLLLINGPIRRS